MRHLSMPTLLPHRISSQFFDDLHLFFDGELFELAWRETDAPAESSGKIRLFAKSAFIGDLAYVVAVRKHAECFAEAAADKIFNWRDFLDFLEMMAERTGGHVRFLCQHVKKERLGAVTFDKIGNLLNSVFNG